MSLGNSCKCPRHQKTLGSKTLILASPLVPEPWPPRVRILFVMRQNVKATPARLVIDQKLLIGRVLGFDKEAFVDCGIFGLLIFAPGLRRLALFGIA